MIAVRGDAYSGWGHSEFGGVLEPRKRPLFTDMTRGVYKYGNRLTPGLTEVRVYAAFLTAFQAEGLRVRFREIPALKTS